MAGFTCWLFGHKWYEAMDPELEMCERCDKLRKKPNRVPKGAYPCPYPNCKQGWTAAAAYIYHGGRVGECYRPCSCCGQMLRWYRPNPDVPWEQPTVTANVSHDTIGWPLAKS